MERMVIEPEAVTERVAVVVMELLNGEEMTTREVAELVGINRGGAYIMLTKISRVTPIYCEKGRWKLLRR